MTGTRWAAAALAAALLLALAAPRAALASDDAEAEAASGAASADGGGGQTGDDDLFGGDDYPFGDDDDLFGGGFDGAGPDDDGDPLEPLNRAVYSLNSAVDRVVLAPAAGAWGLLAPEPIDLALRNFISNLELPITALNALLQGDARGAGATTARFAVNSSAGILGFGDPASGLGLPECDEDLGQTLARWGVGDGPYLMLPLLGPSGLRDLAGGLVEEAILPIDDEDVFDAIFADPLGLSAQGEDNVLFSLAVIEVLQFRLDIDEGIRYVRENALDEYAFLRSFYRQNRASEAAATCGDLLAAARAGGGDGGDDGEADPSLPARTRRAGTARTRPRGG